MTKEGIVVETEEPKEQQKKEEEQKKKEEGKDINSDIEDQEPEEMSLDDLMKEFPKEEPEKESQEENVQKKVNDQAGKSLLSLVAVLSAKRIPEEKQAKYIEEYIQFNKPVLEQLDFFELYGSLGSELNNGQKITFSVASLLLSAFIVPKMID